MGLASILAENERLRRLLEEREAVHAAELAKVAAEHAAELAKVAAEVAEREAKAVQELSERDAKSAQELAERDAKVALLTASNEDMAQRLDLLRLKHIAPRNERYGQDATLPLPFVFVPTAPPPAVPVSEGVTPPPRSPVPEGQTPHEADELRPRTPANKGPNGRPARQDPAARKDRPVRTLRCKVDRASACGACGGSLKVIGADHSARIEWIPGHFETLAVERERCVCPECPSTGVLVAPPPSFALPRALCGNGLLARVLTDKFADRIPLNLQVERMKREGETFSTATLSDWVRLGAAFLDRIALAIESRLLANGWLQADDTGLPVQDGTDGRLRKGRLWAYTDQREVRYIFTDTKEGKNPAAFLVNFQGKLLLVDGGSEFNDAVFLKGLIRGGCWSHLRRYFFEARIHYPQEARLALGTIRDLFSLEASLVDAPLEVVREVRDRDARPLVQGLFDWILAIRPRVRPTSLLGAALTYAINGRDTFMCFLDHPELPMHNNRSELALRGPVVGRKQWLFAGSQGGAVAAATMFTLIGSCKLQGIDPWTYLADVLSRLGDHRVNRVHELTPLAWRLAREGGAA